MALHTGEVAVSALDTDSTILTQPLPQSILSSSSSSIAESSLLSPSDPSMGSPAPSPAPISASSSSATLDFFLTPRKKGLKDEYKPWGMFLLECFARSNN